MNMKSVYRLTNREGAMTGFVESFMFIWYLWREVHKYRWWADEANEDEVLVSAFMAD